MTKAERWGRAVDTLSRDDRGYYDRARWARIVNAVNRAAANIETLCPGSADSSFCATFRDGSKLYVANPQQAYFPAFAIY